MLETCWERFTRPGCPGAAARTITLHIKSLSFVSCAGVYTLNADQLHSPVSPTALVIPRVVLKLPLFVLRRI
jgi:hypothetical protein